MGRGWWLIVIALVGSGCQANPIQPTPDPINSGLTTTGQIVISNLQAHVLGREEAVCGGDPDKTLTNFTFDFQVQGGLDLANDAAVYRLGTSAPEQLANLRECSSGPCSITQRACIRSGQSTNFGTIELYAAERYRDESSWTIELRKGSISSNPVTAVVSYSR
jgi:hypothetical protein